MDQNYIGIEGLEYPANGSKLFQEDFIKEQDAIGKEIINRQSDLIKYGIIYGFEVTASATTGCINISAGIAYDNAGNRLVFDGISDYPISNPFYGAIVAKHIWHEEIYVPDGDSQQKVIRRHSVSIEQIEVDYGQQYIAQQNEIILAYCFRYNEYLMIIDSRSFINTKQFCISKLPCNSNVIKNDVVVFKNNQLIKACGVELINTFNINSDYLDMVFFDKNKCIIVYDDKDNNSYGTILLYYVNSDGIFIPINKIVFKQSGIGNVKIQVISNKILIYYLDAVNNNYITATLLSIDNFNIKILDTKYIPVFSNNFKPIPGGLFVKNNSNNLIYKSVSIGSTISFGSDITIDTGIDNIHYAFYMDSQVVIYFKNGSLLLRIYNGSLGNAIDLPQSNSYSVLQISQNQLLLSYNSGDIYMSIITINGLNATFGNSILLWSGNKVLALQLSDKYFLSYSYGTNSVFICKINSSFELETYSEITIYNFYGIPYNFKNFIISAYKDSIYYLNVYKFNNYDGFILNVYDNEADFVRFTPNFLSPIPINSDKIYINFGLFDTEPALPAFNCNINPLNFLVGEKINEHMMKMLCIEF